MQLKQQIFQLLRSGFCVIILAVMTCAEYVLVTENAAFLQSQGKAPVSSFCLATCAALLIPIISSSGVSRRSKHPSLLALIGKCFFVSSLILLQVWFASQTAIAPQLDQIMSNSERSVISEYREQIRQYDNQIAEYQKRIDAYPEKYRSKKTELTKKQADLTDVRRIALSELRRITESAGSEPTGIQAVFWSTTVIATVLYRLALEIGVIFLAGRLRMQLSEILSESGYENAGMQKMRSASSPSFENAESVPEISQTANNKERITSHSNPRTIVLQQYPDAVCKSANGRRGPFTVYADSTEKTALARSQSNVSSWKAAAENIIRIIPDF